MYAIVDIETNGLNNSRGKITEIAIYKHDGNKIVDSYESLINPEGSIPYEIQRLTGITNQMVEDAPRFYEVAKEVLEFTEGCVFVAHNVNFDYGFFQREFKELGYQYQREKVCTVKQSRLLLPGHRSYSLGKLCRDLNIEIEARHRAAGDARATVVLFEKLLSVDKDLGLKMKKEVQLSKYLHPDLNLNLVLEAPKQTGVYYLKNKNGDVIYVGKSLNIRTRLYNHLRQPKTQKAIQMHNEVADIEFCVTGSELAALLHESREIKRLKPKYNVALKRASFPIGLFSTTDLFGYQLWQLKKIKTYDEPITAFTSLAKGKSRLEKIADEFGMCLGLMGIQSCSNGCIKHAVGSCSGAALLNENSAEYNTKVEKALKRLSPLHGDMLVIDRGPEENLLWAFLIKNSKFEGMGTFDPEYSTTASEIIDCIQGQEVTPDDTHILASHLRRKKVKRILELSEDHAL